jgi:hypothetical protein
MQILMLAYVVHSWVYQDLLDSFFVFAQESLELPYMLFGQQFVMYLVEPVKMGPFHASIH